MHLHTAWSLANLYLVSCDAEPLSAAAQRIIGLGQATTCFVSMQYFRGGGRFDDVVVHEAAHIFHNCKRERVGLKGTRRREWLLEIDCGKRETFAYACEALSEPHSCVGWLCPGPCVVVRSGGRTDAIGRECRHKRIHRHPSRGRVCTQWLEAYSAAMRAAGSPGSHNEFGSMTGNRRNPTRPVAVDTFRDDPMFPRIERVVADPLAKGNVAAPVDFIIGMGLLRREHLDDWRRGACPTLSA